ncbi:MAG: zinc ribbon domain-containing protein [Candidatus Coatesbacteria bacterium]|nr:MAG: zinc ribbon domain-containing protein [Candidatus Coatesbacteria bacterium]
MPVYEYECAACGARFEILVREPGTAPGPCPSCGSRRATKLFSVFAVATAKAAACPGAPETTCSSEAPCHHHCPWEQ